jgi:acid phosphatase
MTLLRKAILVATTAATLGLGTARLAIAEPEDDVSKSQGINHIVVIYEENHSFDNLYGNWEGVNGLKKVKPTKATQVNQAGTAFSCLLQNDVNLTSPPLASSCNTEANPVTNTTFNSAFTNAPFQIDNYIAPNDTTCPPGDVFAPNGVVQGKGLPGGCTRDIVHRFYQEQYQINGGKMNRYVTGSDAAGLTMGYYDTKQLPIYKYLHQRHTFGYAIADNFFQSAFGGSFLNHQWLIAAQTPIFPSAVSDGLANDLHSVVDANGFPNKSYPLYTPTTPVNDSSLTVKCPALVDVACGDYAINTIQPTYQPFSPGTADAKKLPPQTAPTIGDRLSEAKVSWAWYSGGWSNANGDIGDPGWTNGNGPKCSNPNAKTSATYPNCPDNLFQFHHQPFNYYANFAPDTQARKEHLRDEQEFFNLAQASTKKCNLYSVNFIKPIGAENEHPGYASERVGSNHLVGLLEAIQKSACAKDTMIIVTYDEFGGQWDHVPPPGQGNNNGPHDEWGPGTRIPALIISPQLKGKFVVDHKSYDTTSILATIERRFGLKPLNSRDAKVNALSPGDDRD